ncbi:peroxiredoxin-like family protein [Paenibacillus sp. S-38]|uniref:peroxiredoxin-like family protein n=1 Tax=Paenibacillus sp. S-38 TaxID=3416710 RepID=UPI003CF1CEE4
MPLREQLEEAKARFLANVPAEAQENVFRHVKEQQQSGIEFGLKPGDKAPDFALDNALGERVTLYEKLAEGPVILLFYRGSWCPYCNIQLRGYQQLLPDIRKHGGQIIAVSPQRPDHSLSQKEKEQLTFHVLSDPDGRAADSYRLLFELPEYLQMTFEHTFRLNLIEYNGTSRWVLPVPATYLIDQEGIIRYAGVNPEFMKRTEPQDIVDELKKL